MNEFKIEKNIPLPPSRAGSSFSQALRKMEVGDSILSPLDGTSASPIVTRLSKEMGRKFTGRKVENGRRYWIVS